MLQKRANEIKSDRLTTFFEELAEGKHELTDELIETEDFLHSYFCTLRAVLNCRHREKIRLFARLLDSAFNPKLQVTPDEHEELLSILESISLREFAILNNLRERELLHPKNEEENNLQRLLRYWDEFKTENIQALDIPTDSFNAFMVRLERTGLYIRLTENYHSDTGVMGMTTPALARLIDLVRNTQNN